MSMMLLKKTVLKRITLSDNAARQRFTNSDALNGFKDDNDSMIIISRMDWDDMGRPDTITVTIERGDKLNDEVDG